jgi:type VI secretion system protein ImpA
MSEQMEQAENPEEGAEMAAGDESQQELSAQPEEAPAEAAESAPEAEAEAAPVAEEAAPALPSYKIPEPASSLSRPHVVNLEALLRPIPGENPSGEYMRYSGVYDEVNEARRSDDGLAQGEWQHEVKTADYAKVISIAVPVLENQSKDLQLGALLSEALSMEHGFQGLRDSLYMLTGLQQMFWDTIHPEIYEGDMEGRANAISLVDSEGGLAIQKAPITPDGYSYFDYLDSKRYEIPADIDSLPTEDADRIRKLEAEAVRLGKVTADKWVASIAQSRRAFFEELNVAIEECLEALKALNLTIEEKFDVNQSPSTRILRKALDDIKTQTDKILEQKRQEEPDEVEMEAEGAEGSAGASGAGMAGTSGAIQSRADALRRLSELAAFFRKTEPHSPVSYLVTRAVKWGNMPLENWLKDVIKDEAILFQIRQTLGFNTTEGDESAQADQTSV